MRDEKEYLDFINNIKEEAFQHGYKKGFEYGREVTIKKILAAASDTNSTIYPSTIQSTNASGSPFKVGTDSEAVYTFILNNPGLRGSEIIKQSGIVGKTVRTALHRLKIKNGGVAKIDGGRWYIK